MSASVALAIVGAAGAALSWYVLAVAARMKRGEPARCVEEVCPIVLRTPYARTLGIPNAAAGLALFVLASAYGCLRALGSGALLFPFAAGASVVSLAASLYLLWALAFRIQRW